MNLKTIVVDSKRNVKMTLLFFVLAITLEILMFAHWIFILEPRIKLEAEANAQIIAESQGRLISQSLISTQGIIKLNSVNAVMEKTLLLKDPLLKQPFFIGVSLEIDPDSLSEQSTDGKEIKGVDTYLAQGNNNCPNCFSIDVGLYSSISDELIGVAYFQVNDAIFQKFKTDIKNKLLVEAIIVLFISLLVWYAAILLVKQLQTEIRVRRAVELELRKAKQLAEDASEAKGQFLANMTHELRTPLNAVIGLGYMVLKGELSPKQRDYMQKMDTSAHMLLNLINDILDFSKSESGKLELESISFTIDDVLDDLHKLVISKAEEKQVDLVFSVANNVPQNLIGDPLRLGQVLLNLCSNAIKFTDQGTIVIAIDKIKTESNTIKLKFSIKDTGIGMDSDQQKKLFQSFSQVDSSTTRKHGGTGLGLAICKQLTELMQGEIWVESMPGTGSTFSFSAVFGLDKQSEESKTLPVDLNNMQVLVIDDNTIALDIFTEMLHSFSFNVYTASTAEKGLQILDQMNDKNMPIKLILMDWRLPGINGIEAARLIKERTDLKFMPNIILMTAYTKDEIIESARNYLDAYIPKPITHSYLYDSIISLFADINNGKSKKIPVIANEPLKNNGDLYYPEAKLLLVEDNVTNQEVAIAILEDTAMNIDIANNGNEAITKIRDNDYDLVLMDIQMPVMDGLEATRLLRKDSKNDHLPIIAMTAHALQKDKDECIAKGMNDFIAKPFVVDEFLYTLKKWLPKPAKNSTLEEIPLQKKTIPLDAMGSSDKVIDINEALDRLNGNAKVLVRVLGNFVKTKETHINNLKQNIADNNWQQAGKIVHGLKGSGGNICAHELYNLCIKLEHSFEQLLDKSPEQAEKQAVYELVDKLDTTFDSIEKTVEKFKTKVNLEPTQETTNKKDLTQYSKISTEITDKAIVLQLLKRLEEMIKENNLGAKVVFDELNSILLNSEFSQDLQQLEDYLEDYKYELALSSVIKISKRMEELSL